MSGCCDPRGCDGVFDDRFARQQAKRYRRRGLRRAERHMVDFLVSRGIEGATVLEIGGGVGELHLELLRRGAARATNLELVDVYDELAYQLAAEAGLGGRIQRRVLDIASTPEEVAAADVVVMHRVVCCYPDYERLLGAAADHAQRLLVFSYPARNVISRLGFGGENAMFRITNKTFRTFLHPPEEMVRVLSERGLRRVYAHRGMWRVAGLERVPAPDG